LRYFLPRAYAILEAQWAARRIETGGGYALNRPAYSHYYERVLIDGDANRFSHIFTLRSTSETVAVL
jgi:hypothetical protein